MSERLISAGLDISSCDQEPIHIPGSIQPYGFLLVVDSSERICQSSENVNKWLGKEAVTLLETRLKDAVGFSLGSVPEQVTLNGEELEVSVHQRSAVTILEFEPTGGPIPLNMADIQRELGNKMPNADTIRDVSNVLVSLVSRLCGFDRVMVYRFLPDDTGVVIAEEAKPGVDSYLGLRYPASDIPVQARALYVRNWTRLVADVNYVPSPIAPTLTPGTNQPLDMSDCSLRSVSPIHVEYLKNMGVGASMSISIVRNGRLWGLIACHHLSPWYGGKRIREMCELIGKLASLQVSALEDRRDAQLIERGQATLKALSQSMSQSGEFWKVLANADGELLDLVNAVGAAVIQDGRCHLIGATPSTTEVMRLTRCVGPNFIDEVFASDHLAAVVPEADRYSAVTSGMLAICISATCENYVLWFRPEIVETVNWAGAPQKEIDIRGGENLLRPRTSFSIWKEEVHQRSAPWLPTEITLARHLRIAILESELKSINTELEKRVLDRTAALQKAVDELNGFTYSVSHDLRTPLRGMIGNCHIIVEEYGDQVAPALKAMLRQIEANALRMANLVDDLLSFARLGRQELSKIPVNLSTITKVSAENLIPHGWPCENLDLSVEDGMYAVGDPDQLEILLTILIENGCKYRTPEQRPTVWVSSQIRHGVTVYEVRNLGIGFDNIYADRLFMPFERLHRESEYPGTGIGLANAKRIVERHGGSIWAEGRPGEGASFFFTL